ncbi:MAG: putative DNA-binding domain-containing protein [Polyangiales bacterium]
MSDDFDALARALRRVCLAPTVDPADLARLGPGRWSLYRDLVRGRIVGALAEALPRTRDAAGAARFDGWISHWLDDAPPTTRYVRALMPQFVAWREGRDARDLPPCFDDLLRYEVALHAVGLAPDPAPEALRATPFEMHRPARFHPVLRRLDLRWPVHARFCEREPATDPSPCALLIYRDAQRFQAETLALSPVAARVIDAMRGGGDVTTAVQQTLAAEDLHAGAAFVESFADLLADLMERGVLLGAAP